MGFFIFGWLCCQAVIGLVIFDWRLFIEKYIRPGLKQSQKTSFTAKTTERIVALNTHLRFDSRRRKRNEALFQLTRGLKEAS